MLSRLNSDGVRDYESVSVSNCEFLMTAEIILPGKRFFFLSDTS